MICDLQRLGKAVCFTAEKKKTILVESWGMMRTFMEECLSRATNCSLEESFSNTEYVFDYLNSHDSDLLIMELPAKNEEEILDLTKEFKTAFPKMKIVHTTLTCTVKLMEKSKEYGADAIWQKEFSEDSLSGVLKPLI